MRTHEDVTMVKCQIQKCDTVGMNNELIKNKGAGLHCMCSHL